MRRESKYLAGIQRNRSSHRPQPAGRLAKYFEEHLGRIFCFTVEQQLNYLQLVGDYHLYDIEQFDARKVEQYANVDPTIATAGLQAQRAQEIYDRVKGLNELQTTRELIRQQNQLMTDAMGKGQRIFFVLPSNRRGELNRLLPKAIFVSTVVTSWDDSGDFKAAAKPHWLGVTRTNVPVDIKRAIEWQLIEIKTAPPPKSKIAKPRLPATKPVKKDKMISAK